MTDPRATLAAFRAATLAVNRDQGTATGPDIEAEIDLAATEALCSGASLLHALQCVHADTVAQDYGWPSAIELMTFLTEGPETARFPQ